jgi:hypothetical protein
MSYTLMVPSKVVSSYQPRTPLPLSGHPIAEERGIEHQQVLRIEAPEAPLPVALRNEIVPSPDSLWQRLSGQESLSRAECLSQLVTWEVFLMTM